MDKRTRIGVVISGVVLAVLAGVILIVRNNTTLGTDTDTGHETETSASVPDAVTFDAVETPPVEREEGAEDPVKAVGPIVIGAPRSLDPRYEAALADAAAKEAERNKVNPANLPMAKIGASRGIDTSMDAAWTPDEEALHWFEGLEQTFEDARPLTPDLYRSILSEHHDTTTEVFQRAAEIGEVKGPETGMEFLETWNSLVDEYKAEAYGD